MATAKAGSGLSARMTAEGTGINWRPTIGRGDYGDLSIPADYLWVNRCQFSAIGQVASLDLQTGEVFGSLATPLQLTASGVTGSGAADINGVYVLKAPGDPGGPNNGMPWWLKSATGTRIYYNGEDWRIESDDHLVQGLNRQLVPTLSGVVWRSTDVNVVVPADFALAVTSSGSSPVWSGMQGKDFEGQDLPASYLLEQCATEIVCTAGQILIGYAMMGPLAAGGRFFVGGPVVALEGLQTAPGWESIAIMALTADAAFDITGGSRLIPED